LNAPEKLDLFRDLFFTCIAEAGWELHAWAILSNHYPWCSAAWFARTAASGFRKTVESFKTNTLSVTDAFAPMTPSAQARESGVKPPPKAHSSNRANMARNLRN
jgi:hypothetical protein